MDKIKVRVKNLRPEFGHPLPKYATELSAGFDMYAHIRNEDLPDVTSIVLYAGERVLIPSGLAMAIPDGYELQLRPRSGLALKQGITLMNSPATIDADYRGEIGIIVVNKGEDTVVIKDGDRIAQGVVAPVLQADFELVDDLDSTERGEGGFGHSGIK